MKIYLCFVFLGLLKATAAELGLRHKQNVSEAPSSSSTPWAELIPARILQGNSCAQACDSGDDECLKLCYCDCDRGRGPNCNGNPNNVGNFQCVKDCLCPEGGSGANPSIEGNPSSCLKECNRNDLPYDLNNDGAENIDDIVFVARTIIDPLNELPQGDLAADVNADGIVDLEDLSDIIAYIFSIADAAELAPLTPTIVDDAAEYFSLMLKTNDPPPLHEDRRQLKSDTNRPAWIVEERQQQRQLQTCGLGTFGKTAKGDNSQEPRDRAWPREWPYDPDPLFMPTALIWWTVYRVGVPLKFEINEWPEAIPLFNNYMSGGDIDPFEIVYQDAYDSDAAIKNAVDEEVADVLQAVQQIHDGQESSFEFYSTDFRGVRVGTGRWQAALGYHVIWSTGTVTYDQDACSLTVDILIKAEDSYDFKSELLGGDEATPEFFIFFIPGTFSKQGLASPFLTVGEIRRTETIDLQCCKDEDCGDPTEFDCECSLCTTQCPTQQRSGGQGFTSFTVDLFKTSGTIQIYYQMYRIPDQLTIYYEGATIFSTGGLISGSATRSVSYGSDTSTSTRVTVEVNAPNSGTAWIVSVSCPP